MRDPQTQDDRGVTVTVRLRSLDLRGLAEPSGPGNAALWRMAPFVLVPLVLAVPASATGLAVAAVMGVVFVAWWFTGPRERVGLVLA